MACLKGRPCDDQDVRPYVHMSSCREQASPVPFDPTELESIRERMVKYDERRENIIKVRTTSDTPPG